MIGRLRRAVAGRTALIGVIGAVLLLAGGSIYQALITPPYRFIDEQAHAGYVLAVQEGQVPSIDTPIDQAAGGTALRTRLADEPARRHDLWVANNPPLAYVLAAAPAAATRALGIAGGPLMGLRLLNIAAACAAVALTYLLGRDLSGGDRTIGLVSAALVAAAPHVGFVASLGFTDGFALLATTGVLTWLARACGAGPAGWGDRRSVQVLGIWMAVAAAARPMALLLAVAAGLVALGVAWWRRSTPIWWTLGWLAVPAAVTSGWFYVLNVVRYGDPTGSDALLEKMGRTPSGSLWSSLTTKGAWESAFRTIVTRRLEAPLPGDPYGWYRLALVIVVTGVVATAVLVILSAVRNRGTTGTTDLPGTAWAGVALVSLVPVLLVAQHRAGGGAPHPRYLLPMLPVVAAAVALAAVRLTTRWGAIVLVVALAAVDLRQTRASATWLAANLTGPPGSELVTAYGSELLRAACLAAAAAGLGLLVAAVAWSPGRRT